MIENVGGQKWFGRLFHAFSGRGRALQTDYGLWREYGGFRRMISGPASFPQALVNTTPSVDFFTSIRLPLRRRVFDVGSWQSSRVYPRGPLHSAVRIRRWS
jgi:hypothetical protein